MKNIFLSCIIVTSLFNSCNDDDDKPCYSLEENFTTLEEQYGCENPLFEINANWDNIENNHIIISNQIQFEEIVNGSCIPEINFDEYDLVLILTGTSNLQSYEYSVVKTCNNNISIHIMMDESGDNPVVTVFNLLIPKLMEDQIIESISFS